MPNPTRRSRELEFSRRALRATRSTGDYVVPAGAAGCRVPAWRPADQLAAGAPDPGADVWRRRSAHPRGGAARSTWLADHPGSGLGLCCLRGSVHHPDAIQPELSGVALAPARDSLRSGARHGRVVDGIRADLAHGVEHQRLDRPGGGAGPGSRDRTVARVAWARGHQPALCLGRRGLDPADAPGRPLSRLGCAVRRGRARMRDFDRHRLRPAESLLGAHGRMGSQSVARGRPRSPPAPAFF